MQFISNNTLSLICTFVLLSSLFVIIHEAYGDGLTMENLPPASVGDRQASLFIQVSPQILTSDTAQDTFLKLRLFDANNNKTIQSNSFFVKVTKDDQLLMRELFYTKSGVLTIKFKPTDTPGKWQAYGDIEPTLGGWTATNDEVRVDAPVFLEGGLYHFEIKFIGIDAAKNIFRQGDEPTFNSYLSVGDVFKKSITYQTKSYDTTIISYYDKIKDFEFDESKKLISFSMAFDWDISRIEGQNIFVHEEVQISKSFNEFADSTSFTAKVNGIPLVGRMLAVDPYSKEDELILHYLINKNDIVEMSKKVSSTTKTMDFTLSPGNADAKTSTEILTDFGGFRTELRWLPTDLNANTKTNLDIAFFDGFLGNQVLGDIKYDLKVLDKNGDVVFSVTELDALGAVGSQSIIFPHDGVYTLEIDIKSITINGKTDSSRLGIARGYVVIPSAVASTPPFTPTITTPTTTPDETITPSTSTKPKSGCLIATVAFGSELAPQVQQLRETRDNVLLHTTSGTAFMTAFNSVYYTFSPTVAEWEMENPILKEIVKATITPLITTLSILNYVNIDSETEMLGYGIGVILLNIGMYFVAPVFVIMRLKNHNSTK